MTRPSMRPARLGLLLWLAFASGCANDPLAPDVSEDGLVRAPSSRNGAVYRAPGTSFVQYRRILLEPLGVSFERNWEREHPEVSPSDIDRIRRQAAELFRDEFTRELVARGTYTLAEAPGPDVLTVTPKIVDMDISAPQAGRQPGMRSYVVTEGEMTLVAEIHDSRSGALIGRIIDRQRAARNGFSQLQLSNPVTNSHEARIAFQHWSRLLREALDVAKVEKPR